MSKHPVFSEDMREIVESFVVETQDIFDDLNNDLLRLEQAEDPSQLIDKIFRAVHTVKGTSGFLSLEQLCILTHHFEDVLNRLRKGELSFHPGMMDVMFAAFDLMNVLLQQVLDQEIQPIPLDGLLADLQSIADDGYPEGHTAENTGEVSPSPDRTLPPPKSAGAKTGKDAPAAAAPHPTRAAETDAPATKSAAVESHPRSVETADEGAESDPAATSSAQSRLRHVRRAESVRVNVDRLDDLLSLVGELVLTRNRLARLVAGMDDATDTRHVAADLSEAASQIDFITSELQSAVMQTRMVPVGRIFGKFPRIAHDLARELGKKVELVIEGGETELDKSLIDDIGDPLLHLIRNAVDHGIEMPDERRHRDKPEQGRIELRAGHDGDRIVITIEDDGAGIDPEVMRNKAVGRGVLTEEEAVALKDSEILDLIFRPGFSTLDKASHVSGRGVGMDVVKTIVNRMNGSVRVHSTPGKGTCFTLSLPLTLAIIQSLLVRCGGETYALPLHSVREVVALDNPATVRGRPIIRLRDQIIPLVDVAETFGLPKSVSSKHYAAIVAVNQESFGIVVDDLVGQEEIVIKPLGSFLNSIGGFCGSTILGDGRVAMVLDTAAVIELGMTRGDPPRSLEAA